jgi:alanyl-tRNA synthetase
MPITVTDADGNTIEALTEEEINAKVTEATKAATDKVSTLEEQVEQLKKNTANAGALREKTEELAAAKTDADKKAEEALATAKAANDKATQIVESTMKETKTAAINRLAGGDAKLAEKIAFHFDNSTAGDTSTREAVEARVNNAFAIATQTVAGTVLAGSAVSSAGGGSPKATAALSPDELDLAHRLGLSDETLTKYRKQ